jgi:cytochrome b
MNIQSVSQNRSSPSEEESSLSHTEVKTEKVKIWDAPVRIMHWLIALTFAGAYLTAESETWRLLHITLGYTMAGLMGLRVIWGFLGSRYARFSEFVRGPKAIGSYLRSLVRREPIHYIGHNPGGAVAIMLLLVAGLALGGSGYALYNEIGGDWLEEFHEVLANGMLAIVIIHIFAVLISSHLHRENLVRAMITGNKHGKPEQAIKSTWRSLAVVILLAVAGFWWWQWQTAPLQVSLEAGSSLNQNAPGSGEKDDD